MRFEDEAREYLSTLQPTDHPSHFCIATRPEDFIEVIGLIHYRVTDADLFFEYIRVRESCRQRGIARKMLTEVVNHPACLGIPRLHFSPESKQGNALLRHLEGLRDSVERPCGTPFVLETKAWH